MRISLKLAAAILFLGTIATGAASSAATNVRSDARSSGAVSGGGGGTLPANPVSIREIEEIVNTALPEMRLVVREMSRRVFRGAESQLDIKLFGGPKTIVDVLEETGYELRPDKPCLDRFGNEVDASIFANKPNDICISAFRIAPKLIEERARVETLALIFHEISHKLGTTEEEATEFQKDAAYLLSQADPNELRFPQWLMLSDFADSLASSLVAYANRVEQGAAENVLDALSKDLNRKRYDFSGAIRPKNPYSHYTRRQFEYVEWLETRLRIVDYTLNLKFDGQPEYWVEKLDEVFGQGGTVTTYGSFLRSESPTSYRGNDFENNLLTRPQTDEDLIAELRSLGAALREEARFLHPFGSMAGLALLRHASDSPNAKRSPFTIFVGSYKVSDVTCTAKNYGKPEARVPLEIELALSTSGNFNEIQLKKSWASMWATDILQDNGHTSLGGAVMQTDGIDQPGAKMAEATAVFGTPWTERWMVQKTRVEERAGELYYVDTYQTEERTWRGPFEASYRCEGKLTAM